MANYYILIFLILILNTSSKLYDENNYDLIIDILIDDMGEPGLLSPLVLETNLSKPENYFNLEEFENIIMDTKFINKNGKLYNFTCKPWKSDMKENLLLICYLKEALENYGNDRIKLEDYILTFDNKKIKIFSSQYNSVYFIKNRRSFLYARNQTIDLDDEKKDEYLIKFKTGLNYTEHDLFLDSIYLDNCQFKEMEMECKIPKLKLENIASPDKNINSFTLYGFSLENEIILPNLSPINIKHEKKIEKKDIYVEVIKLLSNDLECANSIAFETNINDFPILELSNTFKLNFTNALFGGQYFCNFKKNENSPLLLVCRLSNFDENYVILKEMDNLNISNIHIKYNFILSYNKNEIIRTFACGDSSDHITYIYPQILDFTKEDYLNFTTWSYQSYYHGIRLNKNAEKLICSRKFEGSYIESCLVPKTHFNGLKSGYYYLYHGHYDETKDLNIYYEVTPFKVILPEETNNNSRNINFSLFIVLIYLVVILI